MLSKKSKSLAVLNNWNSIGFRENFAKICENSSLEAEWQKRFWVEIMQIIQAEGQWFKTKGSFCESKIWDKNDQGVSFLEKIGKHFTQNPKTFRSGSRKFYVFEIFLQNKLSQNFSLDK